MSKVVDTRLDQEFCATCDRDFSCRTLVFSQVAVTMAKGQKKTGKGRLDKYYKLAK